MSQGELASANNALRDVVLASQEFRRAFADHFGIGLSDSMAMSYLSAAGPMTAGELALRLGVGSSTLTTMLDRLENADLVHRHQRKEDRRSYELRLTELGTAALERAAHYSEAAFRQLGDDRIAAATGVLRDLARALRAESTRFTADTDRRERPGGAAGGGVNRQRR